MTLNNVDIDFEPKQMQVKFYYNKPHEAAQVYIYAML
jgi:hypothetical protein